MEGRDRRADLLKVADQLINCLRFADDCNAEPGEGEILIVISTNDDYERSLFAELPAFLKAEWKARMEIVCVSCGRPVERERFYYAHPTCYTCLPPPLPVDCPRSSSRPDYEGLKDD